MAKQSTVVLKMLQEKSIKEVEAAQVDLATALKALDVENNKQALLIDYRQGYSDTLTKSLSGGINIESYQNYQNFLSKLGEAIEVQTGAIEMANAAVTLKRNALKACQKKKLSYDVLIERADKRLQKAEQKRDQKMMDEFAMRASRAKTH